MNLFQTLRPMALAAAMLTAVYTLPACASQAGQLTATEMEPLVETVCSDLEAYLDAGIAPDGSPLGPGVAFRMRGGIVQLRNNVLVALGREPLPLPTLVPPLEGAGGD